MTISDTAIKFRYEGNAVTDTFAFSGKAFTAADLVVEIITRATDALEETLTLTTHYSVTIATDGTASITTVAGKIPSATQDIQIRRSLAQTQTVVLPTGTKFPAKSVENAIDRAVALVQDTDEAVNRSLKFPVTSSTTVATLPEPTDDAVLCFDGTTGLFKVGETNTTLAAGATAAAASAVTAGNSATAAAASASAASVSASAASDSADAAAASAAGLNIPSVTSGDATKILQVNAAGDGFEVVFRNIQIYAGMHTTPLDNELPFDGSSLAKISGGTYNGSGAGYERVYAYLWDNIGDTEAPVTGGRGASAAADWAANKKITLPDYRDYALVGKSAAGSITTIAAKAGASTVTPTGSITINAVTLSTANIPVITPSYPRAGSASLSGGSVFPIGDGSSGNAVTMSGTSFGSGTSFTPTGTTTINSTSILQKSAAVNWFIGF